MEIDMNQELGRTVERLTAAAGLLQEAVEKLALRQIAFAEDADASIGRIVATVESRREAELEEKLATAEQKIAELQARASIMLPAAGRKTLPASTASLFAKQGTAVESLNTGAIDAALVSLSLEQRIAVKSQLLRAGLIG